MLFSWTLTATRATSCLVPAGGGGPQLRQLVEFMSATSDGDASSMMRPPRVPGGQLELCI